MLVKLQEGTLNITALGTVCPYCNVRIKWDISGPLLQSPRFETLQLRAYLKTHAGYTACRGNGCTNGAIFDFRGNNCDFECTWCQEYCGWCRGLSHPPGVQCTVQRRATSATLDFWNRLAIAMNPLLKRCPHCKTPIMKNSGCDHMTCLCRGQFCWVCVQPYTAGHRCKVRQFYKVLLLPLVTTGSLLLCIGLCIVPFPATVILGTRGRSLLSEWQSSIRSWWA